MVNNDTIKVAKTPTETNKKREAVMLGIYMVIIFTIYLSIQKTVTIVKYTVYGLIAYALIHGTIIAVRFLSEIFFLTYWDAKKETKTWFKNLGYLGSAILGLFVLLGVGYFVQASVIDIPNEFIIATVLVESIQTIYETYHETKE